MKRLASLLLLFIGVFSAVQGATEKDAIETAFPMLKRVVMGETKYTTDKKYALLTTYNGAIYAVKDALNSNKRFVAENVTDNPVLFDEDNYFYLSGEPTAVWLKGVKSSNYYIANSLAYILDTSAPSTKNKKWSVKDDYLEEGKCSLCPNADTRTVALDYEKLDNFANYSASNQMVYPPAVLYEYVDTPSPLGEFEIGTDEGYGTFYLDRSFVMPLGVTGCTITDADATAGALSINEVYQPGMEVPAGTALLLKGKKGKYSYYAPENSEPTRIAPRASAVGENLLLGLSVAGTTAPPSGGESSNYYYYKLYYLTEADGTNRRLGFFWGAESGAPFSIPANKAYLALNTAQQVNIKGFVLPDNTPTGIHPLTAETDENRASYYSLSGVKYPANAILPKGVYIRGGKKIIIGAR